MIKCMYVSGDSFAFGQELTGPTTPEEFYNFTPMHRKLCYTGIITDELQIPDYTNVAIPGGSNQRVYRKLLFDIPKLLKKYQPSEIFVQISLSNSPRLELYDNFEKNFKPIMLNYPPWEGSLDYDFWELYLKLHGEKPGYIIFNYMMLMGIKNTLKMFKVPYLLTNSMSGEENDKREILGEEMLLLLKSPRHYDDISFQQYAISQKVPFGPSNHPLEEGHILWANRLLNLINERNLFDNSDL